MTDILPPGESPADPAVQDLDAIGFALERVQTHLQWAVERLATYLDAQATDSKTAARELEYLKHSLTRARRHAARLTELVLAGYTIDPNKRLPKFPTPSSDF